MHRTRQIIKIDAALCDGCGLCIGACHEGALQLIDGKARLVSDVYCDGLGSCLGECPHGAITIETRDAADFDSTSVARHLASLQGSRVPDASGPPRHAPVAGACPGSAMRSFSPAALASEGEHGPSQLRNWPVQLKLAPPVAPYYNNARLLLCADCVPFAFPAFHGGMLNGQVLLVGCPKLDDAQFYRDKLAAILAGNAIRGVEVAYMEVPCCRGLVQLLLDALSASGKELPVTLIRLSLEGAVLERREVVPQPAKR